MALWIAKSNDHVWVDCLPDTLAWPVSVGQRVVSELFDMPKDNVNTCKFSVSLNRYSMHAALFYISFANVICFAAPKAVLKDAWWLPSVLASPWWRPIVSIHLYVIQIASALLGLNEIQVYVTVLKFLMTNSNKTHVVVAMQDKIFITRTMFPKTRFARLILPINNPHDSSLLRKNPSRTNMRDSSIMPVRRFL
ncbi:hypothetical protein CDAR_399921 [Caerostris darwini]|uniref:Transmembrane protein n=1 Tax=Caerostris darwini TaxID=1538125 RepID=A0AAV4S563_9ARAC|nr:hypothetical protein CDAR_399921 [Caerostris darwini]